MARFRAAVQGARGQASRLGHKQIITGTNGWDVGVRVIGFIDNEGVGTMTESLNTNATSVGILSITLMRLKRNIVTN